MFDLENGVDYLAFPIFTIMLIMVIFEVNGEPCACFFGKQGYFFEDLVITSVKRHLIGDLLNKFDALNFLGVIWIQKLNFIFGVQEKVLHNCLRLVILIINLQLNFLNLNIWVPNFLETVCIFVFFRSY